MSQKVNRETTRDWDQLSIETPELVAIDMPVAGIGSRFVALLVDYLIWLIAIIALILLFSYVDPSLTRFSKLGEKDRKSTRLNSSHCVTSRMPSSA